MTRALSSLVFLCLACSPLKSNATLVSPPQSAVESISGKLVENVEEFEGIVTAEVDPDSSETQIVQAGSGTNISDVAVAIPPGSLAVPMKISIKEADSISSDAVIDNLGLSGATLVKNSAAAVEVKASAAIDLKVPMVLALPLPARFGLTEGEDTLEKLGVIYKIVNQESGQKLLGVVPASELKLDSNNRILYPTRYFGSFQVALFSTPPSKVEKPDVQAEYDGIMYVMQGLTVPACGKTDFGKMIYVEAEKQFQYCSGNGWLVVDVKGPVGAVGPAGPAGTGSGRTLGLYDANNLRLGEFVSTGAYGVWSIRLPLENIRVNLNVNGGSYETLSSAKCYYESIDCSGQCYLTNAYLEVNDFIDVWEDEIGGTNIDHVQAKVSEKVNSSLEYQSYFDGYCKASSGAAQFTYKAALYNPPPVPAFSRPLTIKVD